MKLSLKWLTPVLLRLLTLSQHSFADAFTTAAFNDPGSVHLVTGFYVGLAANPQPRADYLSLDSATFLPLASNQFALPVMPLHLLGKKSWNVYNQDNIDKVKRDEAAARAREEAEDERMQEIDAERRLQLLRGEAISALPPPPASVVEDQDQHQHHASSTANRERKKRKRDGEDDTDFELRLARDQQKEASSSSSAHLVPKPAGKINNAPITDHTGHISLFPATTSTYSTPPTDLTSSQQRNKPPQENISNLRFSRAAGYSTHPSTAPWYTTPNPAPEDPSPTSNRKSTQDPLAQMRSGAQAARRVEAERRTWLAERMQQMRNLHERGDERARKRRKSGDGGGRGLGEGGDEGLEGLDDFVLDVVAGERERGIRDRERERERERERRRRHRERGRDGRSSGGHHRHRHHEEHREHREHRQHRSSRQ